MTTEQLILALTGKIERLSETVGGLREQLNRSSERTSGEPGPAPAHVDELMRNNNRLADMANIFQEALGRICREIPGFDAQQTVEANAEKCAEWVKNAKNEIKHLRLQTGMAYCHTDGMLHATTLPVHHREGGQTTPGAVRTSGPNIETCASGAAGNV